jgi:TPR repeat protein
MRKAVVSLVVVLALGMDLGLAGSAPAAAAANLDGRMLAEQRHFLECLVYVYNPGLWISHDNRLYFMPRTDSERAQIEAMKAARERYVAFTNRETRHQFVAKILAESGLDADWQKKLLLPYSATNLTLTPVLGRPVQIVDQYSVLKSLPRGDALIQAGDSIGIVLGFGRGASDAYRTNALLVNEGWITYSPGTNEHGWVEAFSDVALTAAETAALDRAVDAFQKKAALLGQAETAPLSKAAPAPPRKAAVSGQATAQTKARQDFEGLKARATETSPFMEYLLAKAYLEGKGTAKDEKLGLLWMNKAAHDGSGDANSYLEGLKGK